MPSHLITLTGKSNELSANFSPPIILPESHSYEIGLVEYSAWNIMSNVGKNYNDAFYFGIRVENKIIKHTDKLTPGNYTFGEIQKFMRTSVKNSMDNIFNDLLKDSKVVNNTETKEKLIKLQKEMEEEIKQLSILTDHVLLKCVITAPKYLSIYFYNSESNIGNLIGFKDITVDFSKKQNIGDKILTEIGNYAPNLFAVNYINISCNLVRDNFVNNNQLHNLRTVVNSVKPTYRINDQFSTIIYQDIANREIYDIHISFTNAENNKPIEFFGRDSMVMLHIRRKK